MAPTRVLRSRQTPIRGGRSCQNFNHPLWRSSEQPLPPATRRASTAGGSAGIVSVPGRVPRSLEPRGRACRGIEGRSRSTSHRETSRVEGPNYHSWGPPHLTIHALRAVTAAGFQDVFTTAAALRAHNLLRAHIRHPNSGSCRQSAAGRNKPARWDAPIEAEEQIPWGGG